MLDARRFFGSQFASLILVLGFLSLNCLIIGCGDSSGANNKTIDDPVDLPSNEEIQRQLDEVLDFTFESRRLNTREHAAWQILHGALAFKRQFNVEHNGKNISAVDHILNGGQMRGWTTERGSELDKDKGRFGLRAILEIGTKTGQGHSDQWLAVLAQCELEPSQPIRVGDQRFTMTDYVRQVQLDIYRNQQEEFSWTLIGLTTYLPTDATWTAEDGSEWSIDKLVQKESEHEIGIGACGGTHRLIGLSMALNRYINRGRALEGPWKIADARVKRAIQNAREFQNADGSFSTNYLQRGGASPDLAQNLGTTGHVLEFLTLSMTVEELQQPWVKRAVLNLCELFRKTKSIPLECGALYHAAHGLVLYRERVFGPRSFGKQSN